MVIRHATVMPGALLPGLPSRMGPAAFAADGKLLAVGRNAEVATPPGAEEIDGTGLYVTPGIIDAHSHLVSIRSRRASPMMMATRPRPR